MLTPHAELRELKQRERALKKAIRKSSPRRVIQQRVQPVGKEQRQPRVRDKLFLQWIRTLPCVECVRLGEPPKPSQAAHIRCGYPVHGWRPTGMQERPSDRRAAPLCATHHLDGKDAQHKHGERGWWEARGIYPPRLCAALSAAFDNGWDGAEVIRRFAGRVR